MVKSTIFIHFHPFSPMFIWATHHNSRAKRKARRSGDNSHPSDPSDSTWGHRFIQADSMVRKNRSNHHGIWPWYSTVYQKWWFSISWDDDIPFPKYMESHNPAMFQSTNQQFLSFSLIITIKWPISSLIFQKWWFSITIPNWMESHNPAMFQSTNQP